MPQKTPPKLRESRDRPPLSDSRNLGPAFLGISVVVGLVRTWAPADFQEAGRQHEWEITYLRPCSD